jgi:Long-chain fatty acid transport protein
MWVAYAYPEEISMTTTIRSIATSVTLALISQSSLAAAFNLNEHSASGLGRAFAGEAAIADNAAVLSRNPAAMSLFSRPEVSIAGTYVKPDIDLKGRENMQVGQSTIPASALDANNIASDAFIPEAYYIQPVSQQFAWGLALFTNYGLATEFPTDYTLGPIAGKSELTTVNINPNASYALDDHWSIGGGITAIYADATLIRRAGLLANYNTQLSSSTAIANLNGDTWSWAWNLGTLYKFNADNRWGLAYRSGSTLSFDGQFIGITSGFNQVPGHLDLELPAIAEFSGYHKLQEKFALHYSVQWTGWDIFKELKATGNQCSQGVCFNKQQDFTDSWRYALGASYYLSPSWTLRSGIALDQQAANDVISIPDTQRLWYSLGTTYQSTSTWSLDFAVAYLDGKQVNIDEPMTISGLGTVTAKYTSHASALLMSAQANYRF